MRLGAVSCTGPTDRQLLLNLRRSVRLIERGSPTIALYGVAIEFPLGSSQTRQSGNAEPSRALQQKLHEAVRLVAAPHQWLDRLPLHQQVAVMECAAGQVALSLTAEFSSRRNF